MRRSSFLYLLLDPWLKEPRYVGISIKPKIRFRVHLRSVQDTHTRRWIKALQAMSYQPELLVICETTVEEAKRLEIALIAKFRALGVDLTK